MTRRLHRTVATAALALAFVVPSICASWLCAEDAAPAPVKITWTAPDLAGRKVTVPLADKTTVLVFAMPDQDGSIKALKRTIAVAAGKEKLELLMVVSGPDALLKARKFADDNQWKAGVVADTDYRLSGLSGVKVWPTTLVVRSDAVLVAHLPGMPASFSGELDASVAFAQGRITAAQRDAAMADHRTARFTNADHASRHEETAQHLLELGQAEQAMAEVNKGLEQAPGSASLQLLKARVLIVQGKPQAAAAVLAAIPAGQIPDWLIQTHRAWAMIRQNQWAAAKPILESAVKFSPSPGQAHYLLGLCCEHDGDAKSAANHFKKAFESTPDGKLMTAKP